MHESIAVLIVDDEHGARVDLIAQLQRVAPNASITEASSRREAEEMLAASRFDVVLLDIQLGNASGFELLHSVPPETAVVFVTAYAEHAVRAFEVDAVDYLLKPVDQNRLRTALERIAKPEPPAAPTEFRDTDWLFLPNARQPIFLQISAITHIVAEGDYTVVHTNAGQQHIVRRSMSDWESRLSTGSFARIHRGTIINLTCVESMAAWSNGGFAVRVRGADKPLIMSKSYAKKLSDALQ